MIFRIEVCESACDEITISSRIVLVESLAAVSTFGADSFNFDDHHLDHILTALMFGRSFSNTAAVCERDKSVITDSCQCRQLDFWSFGMGDISAMLFNLSDRVQISVFFLDSLMESAISSAEAKVMPSNIRSCCAS